jgi:hypothetical protein
VVEAVVELLLLKPLRRVALAETPLPEVQQVKFEALIQEQIHCEALVN